jgi:hypothetical protein
VPDAAATQRPDQGGSTTTSAANINRCVSWVGPNQPGINAGPSLPPYSSSVCPNPGGSNDHAICDPNGPARQGTQTRQSATPGQGGSVPQAPTAPAQPGAVPGGGNGAPQLPSVPNLPNLPNLPNGPKLPHVPKNPNLPNAPNVPNVPDIGGLGGLLGIGGGQQSSGGVGGTGVNVPSLRPNDTTDLLNFLYGT